MPYTCLKIENVQLRQGGGGEGEEAEETARSVLMTSYDI